MDCATKVIIESEPDQRLSKNQTDAVSSSSLEQSDGFNSSPARSLVLPTSRELTNHLRDHNSPRSTTDYSGEEDYSCRVCHKVLSSASSLDRHVLVHSGERPFKCKYCEMAFTTSGNMNRHLRNIHRDVVSSPPPNSCTDSEGSSDSERPLSRRRHAVDEYNNNDIAKINNTDDDDEDDNNINKSSSQFRAKRKRPDVKIEDTIPESIIKKQKLFINNTTVINDSKDHDNDDDDDRHSNDDNEQDNDEDDDGDDEMTAIDQNSLNCPLCEAGNFTSTTSMDLHIEKYHPDYKNSHVINLHRLMSQRYKENNSSATITTPLALPGNKHLQDSIVGFNDLTFVDFSSGKFPTIARAVCEQLVHRPASGESATFLCSKCLRAFPCKSALDSHEIDCGNSNYQQAHKLRDDKIKGNDFFAGLDLQNKSAITNNNNNNNNNNHNNNNNNTEFKEGSKDLADIQSIISVTSGPILPRSDTSTPDHQVKLNSSAICSSGSSGTANSEYHGEEEAQDAFAAEFRRMKLKGEFPCRLCTAIFPNLRALKGHNRAHMGVGPGMPYPCNMCPYTSTDKATLVRHLRSHNGDRPYECSLCNYAFTTKANCERHVRNRHNKLTREEIKSVLIYHPNEDSTNENIDRTSPRVMRDDTRKSLIYSASLSNDRDDYYNHHHHNSSSSSNNNNNNHHHQREHQQQQQHHHHHQHQPLHYSMENKAQDLLLSEETLRLRQMGIPTIIPNPMSHYDKSDLFSRSPVVGASMHHHHALELTHRLTDSTHVNPRDYLIKSDFMKMNDQDSRSSDGSVSLHTSNNNNNNININNNKNDNNNQSLVSETKSADGAADIHQRIQASPIDLKRQDVTNTSEDAPLDLSMDVLDLSKKSRDTISSDLTTSISSDDNNKSNKDLFDANQFLLTQALLKAGQTGNSSSSIEAIYANAQQLLYRNYTGFPAPPASILSPFIFNAHLFNQDLAMRENLQKELVRGLQTSGGNLIESRLSKPASGFPGTAAAAAAYPQNRDILTGQSINESANDYSRLAATPSTSAANVISPRDRMIDNNASSSNSVKMVIKNGILVRKQKQRRYRTERPFICDHCTARFTLRSNMERHVKQQHPQFWCQKPRGGHSTRGRPPSYPPTMLRTKRYSVRQSTHPYPTARLPKVRQSSPNLEDKRPISDRVKYAILAQQLKGNHNEDNDTDEELIIDENAAADKDNAEHRTEERSTSLLRGKLEESIGKNSNANAEDSVVENGTKGGLESLVECKIEPEEDDDEEGDEEEDEDDKDIAMDDRKIKNEDGNADLASVSELLDNASQQYQQFRPQDMSDEEGLIASTSDCNNSGSDEKSDSVNSNNSSSSKSIKKKKKKKKKKSAYSMAPNRVHCPYCERPFPWSSSLRRHILTHTGQKPYRCDYCPLLFTTKSNCDRHLLRKHKSNTAINNLQYNTGSSGNGNLTRNLSSPEAQEVTTINNNNTFSTRNVPERPYKCNLCPSSTFSTLGNLKKHKATKHSHDDNIKLSSRPETPTSEIHSDQQNSPGPCNEQNERSDYESHSSSVSDTMETNTAAAIPTSTSTPISTAAPTTDVKPNSNSVINSLINDTSKSRRPSPRSSPGPSDSPFKCHLCDSGYADRQDCLDHIKDNHRESWDLLVAKGALDMDTENIEEHHLQHQHLSDGEEKRGRFPDYTNRKVMCVFCMRRFWSAEDLRRHMRTHTGERPYSCDICCRRFTLKHSMLRHRKKHESTDSIIYVGTSGDEETNPIQPPTITPRSHHQQQQMMMASPVIGDTTRLQDRMSLPSVGSVATGDAAPTRLMSRFNPYESLTTLTGKLTNSQHNNINNSESTPDTENDLISNLLGIRDKSIIDKVLQASADDAAKLLGVNRTHD